MRLRIAGLTLRGGSGARWWCGTRAVSTRLRVLVSIRPGLARFGLCRGAESVRLQLVVELRRGVGVVGQNVESFLIIAVIFWAYWAPSIVAWARKVPNKLSVIVINALLGWTFVGWVVALAMALRDRRPELSQSQG